MRVVWLLLLAACAPALPARAATGSGPSASLAGYRAMLAEALGAARRVASAPAPGQAEALLGEARRRLPAAAVVTGADGAPVTARTRELTRLLDGALAAKTSARRRALARQFVSTAETLVAAMAPAPPARSTSEAVALRQVLARSEFQRSPVEGWQERVQRWLMEQLRRLFGGVQPAGLETIARAVYYLFWALVIVLLAYLIWTYVPGLRPRRWGRAARLAEEDVVVAPESVEAHLAAADAAAAAGRYLDALRHTYTAMLLRLDAAHLVAFDRARTNREVLRALQRAGNASVRDLFMPVTLTLDEKLYGGRPATDEDYLGCRAAATRLEVLLGS